MAPGKAPAVCGSPESRALYAYHVWHCCRRALLEADADSGRLMAGTGLTAAHVTRCLNGQQRLTLETFVLMATTLGLDPARVMQTALEDAVELTKSCLAAA